MGLQREAGDALEWRAFSGKSQRLQRLSPISADDKRDYADVEALCWKGPDHGTAKFANRYSSEPVAQGLASYLFILTASNQVKW